MGTDDLHHKKKRRLVRKLASRSAKKRVLIVCEGEKTEPNYFKSFRITSAEVRVIGKGYNTKSLIKSTKELVNKAKLEKLPFDQVWCVFDRDSFSKESFNTAIKMATSSGFKVAYSNEAFELWYVLHFQYLTAGIDRESYNEKLDKHLKRKYKKNYTNMYDVLLAKQQTAIKNAKKLLTIHKRKIPADMKPSTKVHLLVKELNKLKK